MNVKHVTIGMIVNENRDQRDDLLIQIFHPDLKSGEKTRSYSVEIKLLSPKCSPYITHQEFLYPSTESNIIIQSPIPPTPQTPSRYEWQQFSTSLRNICIENTDAKIGVANTRWREILASHQLLSSKVLAIFQI